jgi:acid phosphatase type 7
MHKVIIGIALILSLFLYSKNVYALLLGDANCDNKVDGVDFVKWLTLYGGVPQNCPNDADFNDDSMVDGVDYVIWLTNYGKVASPTQTPTPSPTSSVTPTLILTATPTPGISGSAIIAAAGDIACGTGSTGASCKQKETSDIISNINPIAVLPLGDIQYESGAFVDFNTFYNPSWGRFLTKTYPALGNHEYLSANASGYFDYYNGVGNFTGRAGDRGKGYYAFNVGAWRLYALNSNCSPAGGCGVGSAQEKWLRADLVAHPKSCVLAYFHHPLYSSGGRATTAVRPLYQALYDNNAEVVLTGHDHSYERFAPQDANGNLNTTKGIREFVVGTGGRNHTPFVITVPNSEVKNADTFGVLKMTLNANSYSWQFMPIPGQTFTDSGSANCH